MKVSKKIRWILAGIASLAVLTATSLLPGFQNESGLVVCLSQCEARGVADAERVGEIGRGVVEIFQFINAVVNEHHQADPQAQDE